MTKKEYRISNWKDYNTALKNRGNIEIWINKKVLENWYEKLSKKKKRKSGRPKEYSNIAIKCALIIKFLHGFGFRQTQGFLTSLLKLLKLEIKVPDYSTVCKRQSEIDVELLRKHKNCRKLFMLVDSSGLKVFGDGEWSARQHGPSKRRTWIKIHVGVGITAGNKKRIEVVEITKSNEADCKVLPKLLNKVKGKIDKTVGDGAYDNKGNYDTAIKRGAKLIVPPRKGSNTRYIKGVKSPPLDARNKTVRYVHRYGMKSWKEKTSYHVRSLVENMFFRLKTTFGDKLAAHKFDNQIIEGSLKCEILNRMTEIGVAKSYVAN